MRPRGRRRRARRRPCGLTRRRGARGAAPAGSTGTHGPGAQDGAAPYRAALLDWMACAVRGRSEPAARAAAAAGDGLLERVAALGTAGHVLDFDDTYLPGIAHLSAPVAPAAIAVGAAAGATVGDVLAAYARGFEAMGALARAGHPALYDRGWHPTAVCGGVGAAVAAAALLDAPADTATALAALRAGGLRAAFGSDGKSLQVGLAAASGVAAAQLAAAGATVPLERVAAAWRDAYGGEWAEPGDGPPAIDAELDQGVAVLPADARGDRVRGAHAATRARRPARRARPPRLAPGRRLRRRRDAAAGEVLDPLHDRLHAAARRRRGSPPSTRSTTPAQELARGSRCARMPPSASRSSRCSPATTSSRGWTRPAGRRSIRWPRRSCGRRSATWPGRGWTACSTTPGARGGAARSARLEIHHDQPRPPLHQQLRHHPPVTPGRIGLQAQQRGRGPRSSSSARASSSAARPAPGTRRAPPPDAPPGTTPGSRAGSRARAGARRRSRARRASARASSSTSPGGATAGGSGRRARARSPPQRAPRPARPATASRSRSSRASRPYPPACGPASIASRTSASVGAGPKPVRHQVAPASSHGRGSVAGRVRHDDVERARRALAQRAHLQRQLGDRLGAGQVDREDAVPAGGAAHRAPVGPARADPDRDPRLLRGRGRELAAPQLDEPVEALVEQPRRSRGSPGSPNGANSPWRSPPMPTPSTSRPPLRRSSVTVSRASFGIRRRGVGVTSAPIRTRSVAQAIAAIAIHGSASSRVST